jgi:hypothetical protein
LGLCDRRRSSFAVCLAASAQSSDDLARASKSPYNLARYIDSHLGFRWEPLWTALGVVDKDVNLFPCETRGDCTTELITFLDPDQTILHVQDGAAWDTYLRYVGTPTTGWRFAGSFNPMFRYFPRRPRNAPAREQTIPANHHARRKTVAKLGTKSNTGLT